MIDFVYGYPVLAINRKGVTGTGLEYLLKWDLIEKLIFTGSYAYLDMTDREGAPILYRSKHQGEINVQYKMNLLNIQLGIKAWSQQIYEDFLDECHCMPERTLPEKIVPEIILSKKVNDYNGSMHITNLFDTEYELIQDFPMPGRSWQITLTKTLK